MTNKNNNSGNRNSGDLNSGDRNSGDLNSGNWNSGNRNSGNWNSGNWNSGDLNSGNWNSGNRNSGNWNSGNWNSGDWNSGNLNSGNWNSGNRNSGDLNSGNWNSGWFNTNEPKARFFNKDSDFTISELREAGNLPDCSGFYLTKWIYDSEMTNQEKIDNPKFHVAGGYLKTFEYKEAFATFWKETTEENKKKFLNLPNFDADIFLEITGVDVRKKEVSCAGKIVEIEGKKYKLVGA